MTDKKRRQGQIKPNGKKAVPNPICPKCGEYLKRTYTREIVDGKQRFVKSGWSCPSSTCDYTAKDYVELVEETKEDTDKAAKIKKLTDEFVKTHEQLNRLAEQINELEND
jgi:uncharacterized protein YlxW (UPF0749 family)